MTSFKYKIFFTVNFSYKIGERKRVSKSFKSDCNVDSFLFGKDINDSNILKIWETYALSNSLSLLNPSEIYNDQNVTEKKIVTHRIVNLDDLTEVF